MSVDSTIRSLLRGLLSGALTPEQATQDLVSLLGPGDDHERLLIAEQYDTFSQTLEGLVTAVDEFRGVSGLSPAELDHKLTVARRRFAIVLSASLFAEQIPADTQAALSASSSVRRLKDHLSRLADSVASLVEGAIRDSHLRKEFEIAGTVQRMLVPPEEVRRGPLVAHAWYRGAEQCSGDWWTLSQAGSDDAVVMIGDVTGHGAPAAIVAGIVTGALDMALLGMGATLKPYMALNMLNHILIENVEREYFMTAIMARFEPENRSLYLANAGHRAPWVVSGQGVRTLKGHRHPPLGTIRGQRYQDEAARLLVGEYLVAFTDGLVEARNPEGREFGERALRTVCEESFARGAGAVVSAVRAAVEAHVGPAAMTDDITFLVVEAP